MMCRINSMFMAKRNRKDQAICFASLFTTSLGHGYGHASHVTYDSHHSTAQYESAEQIELYTVFATNVFDFVAKLIRGKVEIILWVKKVMINLLVPAFAHLRHLFIHNADYVNGIIHTVAELLKILLTSKPHFAIPQVTKVITAAEHEYIPHGHY